MGNAIAIPVENNVQAATESLIPVFTGALGAELAQLVDARSLHRFLGVDTHFKDWISRRIDEYGFSEGGDFVLVAQNRATKGRGGDRRSKDYHITLDMAKELSMVERNEKGRQARRYFIECEKRLHELAPEDLRTIAGKTIGTDGFHCLGALLDGKVHRLPAKLRTGAKNHVWSQVRKAFSVSTVEDIPASQMDSVRNFIAAYALEGEWIQKPRERGLTLSLGEADALYGLMSHLYFAMRGASDLNLFGVSSSLGSRILMSVAEHLQEASIDFKRLDKRRDEIYAAYLANSSGRPGGYAMSA
ncbi:Phage anti-repressor protein [Pseudomonas citronellolis]|uniref:Phage anti-repressor protein n=1 Tax=Pseudomonas citronellolis TaxID=53408 RepID=A0AAQ1HN33_9PSED|nr:antA/AntB antirepressor family protein [Pseudomonas citronellolis]SFC84802.1 Phage anti-repressor protein [Pseudomonas citronellolis]